MKPSFDPKSLVKNIVEHIEWQIIEGILPPGERITEQKICDELNVSRSPLREAFRILENRGFLISRERKGVTVTEMSLKEAIDIYIIRANLESLSTFLTVKNSTPQLIADLKEINAELAESAKEGDVKNYSRLNKKFHETMIQGCGNKRLIDMIGIYIKNTDRCRMEVISHPGKMKRSIKGHEMLIKSIEDGNAEEAESLRKETIQANISILKEIHKEGNKNEN